MRIGLILYDAECHPWSAIYMGRSHDYDYQNSTVHIDLEVRVHATVINEVLTDYKKWTFGYSTLILALIPQRRLPPLDTLYCSLIFHLDIPR